MEQKQNQNTEEPRHFCVEGGYLIGGNYSHMGTPHQYMYATDISAVGCSMLRCDDCGVMVANVLGRELAEGVKPCEAYWEPGTTPTDSTLLVPTRWSTARLYCCRCTMRLMLSSISVQPSPPYDYFDHRPLNWRCAGHLRLPRYINDKDQLAVAQELLVSQLPRGMEYPTIINELRLMLRAADNDLLIGLIALLQDVLITGEGLRLARALGATEAAPGVFARQLKRINPDHERFSASDPISDGWTLRERLSHTVGECILRAPKEAWAWCDLQELAKRLMVGTRSIKLIEAICIKDPSHVAYAFAKMNGAT